MNAVIHSSTKKYLTNLKHESFNLSNKKEEILKQLFVCFKNDKKTFFTVLFCLI